MAKIKNKTITETLLMKFRLAIKVKLNYFIMRKYKIIHNYIINFIIKNRISIKMKIMIK